MKYILNLTFSLWCELLSKKMVYNGTHADKALIAQSVPVHTTQDVYCLIDLITVNILEDDVYQTQVSLCEDTCHKKYIKSSESFKNKNNKNTFNSREEKKKNSDLFLHKELETWGLRRPTLIWHCGQIFKYHLPTPSCLCLPFTIY